MRKGMLIKVQIEGDKARLESELIGTESDKLLIIRIPSVYNAIDTSKLIYKGNTIYVRYQRWGSLLGFQSQIMDFDFDNEKSITIDYPKKIESYGLRRSKRIDCYLPVNVSMGSNMINGNIINISKDGCLIAIESDVIGDNKSVMQINAKLDISFHLPQVEECINVEVAQRNLVVDKQGIRIGTEYNNMDYKALADLNCFLLQALE
jgi:hypothetical protein